LHIDHSQLDNEMKKANADALSRTAAIASSMRRINRGELPAVPARISKQRLLKQSD
jgi:hypothetical protein